MVFVKVRETYDLHTITGKMSVLAIHTPKPEIIIKNYPGLLMQCKAYRPVSCNVRCACASMLPADPLQVGVATGDVAPEDMFNPILYKATSNFGMSQIEARINHFVNGESGTSISGDSVTGRQDGVISSDADDFDLYYGFLSDVHQWKHANPQSGFEMRNLKPLVSEILVAPGDNPAVNPPTTTGGLTAGMGFEYPADNGSAVYSNARWFKGSSKPMPWINCTVYNGNTGLEPGFTVTSLVNAENVVPAPQIVVGAVIVPPSRLHELYYRMVVEWSIEFSGIRSLSEITNWAGLKELGQSTHLKTYDYSNTSKALGVDETNLKNDVSMASANVDINKVM